LDLGGGLAGDVEELGSAGGAGEEADVSAGQAKEVGQEGDEGFVGAAIGGWGGEGDFDGSGVDAGDGVFAGAGMDADGEGAPAGQVAGEEGVGRGHGAAGWRLPKRAVPMRTQVLPSSMATAKSLDMPMESWVRVG